MTGSRSSKPPTAERSRRRIATQLGLPTRFSPSVAGSASNTFAAAACSRPPIWNFGHVDTSTISGLRANTSATTSRWSGSQRSSESRNATDLAGGEAQARVAGSGDAAILLPLVAQAGVDADECLLRAVGRAVVDDDELEVLIGLGERALDGPLDVVAPLIRRDDRGDRKAGDRTTITGAPARGARWRK